MKTYLFTILNTDTWAIADTNIIVVAENKNAAKNFLIKEGYHISKTSELVELKSGIHIIQDMLTQ